MNKFSQRICVITGAGSGIGAALATAMAERGARLALTDNHAENLNDVAEELISQGHEVLHTPVDVADRSAVFKFAEQVESHYGAAHIVVNNAGVALGSGPLWTTSLEDFDWLMQINFNGVLYGTKAFLPLLMQQDIGHIVNISSLFGLIGVPEQNAYNASKFAVRGLTEALRHELKIANSSVSCTSVHPGGVKTNIARNARAVDASLDEQQLTAKHQQQAARFDKFARTTSASAAQQIIRAVEKDKPSATSTTCVCLRFWLKSLMQSWRFGLAIKLAGPAIRARGAFGSAILNCSVARKKRAVLRVSLMF